MDVATNWIAGRQHLSSMGTPGQARDKDSMRFHQAYQKGTQLKTYELFISGILHLILSDYVLPRAMEIIEHTKDEGTTVVSSLIIKENCYPLPLNQFIYEPKPSRQCRNILLCEGQWALWDEDVLFSY